MDGRKLKFTANPVTKYFSMDSFGSLIPSQDHLQMEKVKRLFERQLKGDTGLRRRLAEIVYRTDVEFTDNPYGNTPTLGAGYRMFGPRPLSNVEFKGRLTRADKGRNLNLSLDKRQRKIVENQKEIMSLHEGLKPAEDDSEKFLLWEVEGDQMMTGGGFDGNAIGEVHKSGLHFILEGTQAFDYADSQYSQLIVEASREIKESLIEQGLTLGSLEPQGAQEVRLAQESDGMIGFPVYAKALSKLTPDIAVRLLIESGVDTRRFVGTTVMDSRTGEAVPYRVIDALAYVLDNSVIDASDAPSLVTLLARIQKHGWTSENGEISPKKAKTRSIYPNAARAGIIEAMIINPFIERLKELKVSMMPSLQDKPTRVGMIKSMIEDAFSKGYDYLAADWSKYDATVKGAILATVMYHAVRPFYKSEWYDWIDFAIYCLAYKYLIFDTNLCELHNEEFQECRQKAKFVDIPSYGYTIFGTVDGLISGAKFTHVGGSMYGLAVIHRSIPRLLGYDPIWGCQAGDDTLVGVPLKLIDTNSVEKTYEPWEKAAASFGLNINKLKQIFFKSKDEIVKVFLQDTYHHNNNIWGIGSIFRPYDAVFFSERQKNLSVAEQLMAEISRMEQGSDNPFCDIVVEAWLQKEQALGVLFKEHGVNAFDIVVDSIGLPIEEVAKRVDVGSFSFGVSRDDLVTRNLKILPVMAHVASQMTFTLNASKALSMIGVSETEGMDSEDDLFPTQDADE